MALRRCDGVLWGNGQFRLHVQNIPITSFPEMVDDRAHAPGFVLRIGSVHLEKQIRLALKSAASALQYFEIEAFDIDLHKIRRPQSRLVVEGPDLNEVVICSGCHRPIETGSSGRALVKGYAYC